MLKSDSEKGLEILEMLKSPGWQIMSQWITDRINQSIEFLISNDPEKRCETALHQGKIEAYRSITGQVNMFLQLARKEKRDEEDKLNE
jgi:hypothetical protein